MWLLNHTTLRRFEIAQLHRTGIREVFTPKSFPYDEGNASASLDWSLDAALTIPPEDLALLNRQDWYGDPGPEAWAAANRHFDVAFIGGFPAQIEACVDHFQGAVVLRVFGQAEGETYTRALGRAMPAAFEAKLRGMGGRFWFGAGYEHLKETEGDFFKKRDCFLPLGLVSGLATDSWTGSDPRVFFICPRIGSSPHYREVYESFKKDFAGLPYVVGGIQPVRVDDPAVLGFVPPEAHERNMRELRAMYYHNTAPGHVHYHPFEAMRTGMPVVFRAGGMLDRFGGSGQPGRCSSAGEARRKLSRLLGGDRALAGKIRARQTRMLEPMKPENWGEAWQKGFQRILDGLERSRNHPSPLPRRKRRIAVILPQRYRGGVLRATLLTARAIEWGSRQAGEPAEVVFAHPDDPHFYRDEDFEELPPSISRRPFQWKVYSRAESLRACLFAGVSKPLDFDRYMVPDDGIAQFNDCDLWVTGDRLEFPLLPVKPYAVFAYDFIQRYEKILTPEQTRRVLEANHQADRVFVTTEFTRRDALQYAGLPPHKVVRLPMLTPQFHPRPADAPPPSGPPYFLWTTNLAPHKNHAQALRALARYYDRWDGGLECRVTGPDTRKLFRSRLGRFREIRSVLAQNPALREKVKLLDNLPDTQYQAQLAGARFLWHPAWIDNGTFSVVEAAHLGVPSLSSDYPAMREMDQRFSLGLAWMDPHDPADMAARLAWMEKNADAQRRLLPSREKLGSQSLENSARAYWDGVRDCL